MNEREIIDIINDKIDLYKELQQDENNKNHIDEYDIKIDALLELIGSINNRIEWQKKIWTPKEEKLDNEKCERCQHYKCRCTNSDLKGDRR